MQFTVLINQARALEWGLTAQQAMLFSFVYGASAWADSMEWGGRVYFYLNRKKVIDEMPLLTTRTDTVYRLLKQLEEKGLVVLLTVERKPYVSITRKGGLWNNSDPDPGPRSPCSDPDCPPPEVGKLSEQKSENNPNSENYPRQVGKLSEHKSENYPRYQSTRDHITNINNPDSEKTKPKPAEKPAKGRRLPSDWVLPDDWRADADQIDPRLRPRLDSIAAEFRDYWISVAGQRGVKLDWRATWRNRLRQVADRLPAGGSPPPRGWPPAGGQSGFSRQGGPVSSRDRSIHEDLSDRSWADSLPENNRGVGNA